MNIKCGKCGSTHPSVAAVKACYSGSNQSKSTTLFPDFNRLEEKAASAAREEEQEAKAWREEASRRLLHQRPARPGAIRQGGTLEQISAAAAARRDLDESDVITEGERHQAEAEEKAAKALKAPKAKKAKKAKKETEAEHRARLVDMLLESVSPIIKSTSKCDEAKMRDIAIGVIARTAAEDLDDCERKIRESHEAQKAHEAKEAAQANYFEETGGAEPGRQAVRTTAGEKLRERNGGSPAKAAGAVQDGMYRNPESGEIFRVQKAVHGSGNLYAKRLIAPAFEGGKASFEYAPGAVRKLKPEWRMTLEEAKEYGALYGCCIRCCRTLTREESIERQMGPVCSSKNNWA